MALRTSACEVYIAVWAGVLTGMADGVVIFKLDSVSDAIVG